MAELESRRYKVIPIGLAIQQLYDLAARAAILGMKEEFIARLREIGRQLEQNPVSWGDHIGSFRAAGLEEYHRLHEMLSIRYYLDRANYVVYLKQCKPVLSHPLT